MDRRSFLRSCAVAAAGVGASRVWGQNRVEPTGGMKPNIVFILADDLGYGDVDCLNTHSDKIPTPNMDRLAAQGMFFTDAHSGSAVCTPTRYGIITGQYCWRSSLKKGVLNGYSKLLIDPQRQTVASLLKGQGYETACIGKWHLGLGDAERTEVDYNANRLRPGPNELGFDYWFGIPASLDMPPYTYIQNGQCTLPPTGTVGGSKAPRFWRGGAVSDDFEHDAVMPTITEKAVGFIDAHCRREPEQPFFLYFAMTAPHTPYLPLTDNVGKSQAGIFGDFVTLCDWAVGQVVEAVEKNGQRDNTLIILTSDNGCHLASAKTADYGHDSNFIYRGQKADIWDGGHRVPFIVRWPDQVRPGRSSGQMVCLTDLMATCAEITGCQLPDNAAEDSYSLLAELKGVKATQPVREAMVHHSINGGFAIRKGPWKFVDGVGSMGWSGKGDELPGQLYDMKNDVEETTNLYESADHQGIVKELKALLEQYKSQGYSRPLG